MKCATSIAISLFTERLQNIQKEKMFSSKEALHLFNGHPRRADGDGVLLPFSKHGNGTVVINAIWHTSTFGSQARTHDVSATQHEFYGTTINLHSWHNERVLLKQMQGRKNVAIFFVEKKGNAIYAIKLDAIGTLRNSHVLFFGQNGFDYGRN
jgi:hypothetical protein